MRLLLEKNKANITPEDVNGKNILEVAIDKKKRYEEFLNIIYKKKSEISSIFQGQQEDDRKIYLCFKTIFSFQAIREDVRIN